MWSPVCLQPVLDTMCTVYVSSGGVIARIVLGNVTCLNGVVHFIDTMLGYVYNTARDEVELNHMAL